jgi:hypothetical protein
MRVWRRARVDKTQAESEAQAALAVADQHAQAGLQAQVDDLHANGEAPRPGSVANKAYVPWMPPGAAMPPPIDTTLQPAAPPVPIPTPAAQPMEMQTEFLRVLEVVTRMCDHVIEYIEADRQERKIMVETLSQLARVIATNTNAVQNAGATHVPVPTVAAEHVIGGSMEKGPEPQMVVDLREPEPMPETRVEVRCSFGEGERWVDGFEIIDVTEGEEGPMYRLRRQRDGAILPQLFEAASIRHVASFQELEAERRTTWSKL